jgi:hypothetical protein
MQCKQCPIYIKCDKYYDCVYSIYKDGFKEGIKSVYNKKEKKNGYKRQRTINKLFSTGDNKKNG